MSSPDLTKVTAAIDQRKEQEINIPNSLLTDKSEDTTPGVESEKIQTTVPDFVETEVTSRNDLPSTFVEPCNPIKRKAPAGYEFCRPLPVEDENCCSTQYECNVSTTMPDPTYIIESVTEENDTRFDTTNNATGPTPVTECMQH